MKGGFEALRLPRGTPKTGLALPVFCVKDGDEIIGIP
ncbi:hypothetical protein SFHH103_00427 [Sinorhizobium fredii HH103]|uniref:Uncharacterized protein n=1 Tax=Sinorhizobium fredii (strain HH103) TaxID=1117943 RepID=G9A126_SINF1|nr:hypothetical protein SFHH103_00427 [Sinorhizobium fredii HH103]